MNYRLKDSRGFSAIELTLTVLIIGLIAGAGYHVYKTRNKTPTASNSNTQNTTAPAAGTTASIDQLLKSEATTEETTNDNYMLNEVTNASSSNTAAKNVGGAYDETTY